MGEVKSTLEIALEKASAMEISSEERKRFKREEALSKARDILQLYTNHPNRLSGLAQPIKESGKDASLLKQCLTELLLEALDPAHFSERKWEGLQELGLRDTGPFRETFNRIIEEDARARREEAEKVESVVRESLAKAGISGTAVEPNIEQSSQWKDIMNSLDQGFSAKLDRLRQKITRVIEESNSSPR